MDVAGIEAATVEALGDAWGEPLWRFAERVPEGEERDPEWSIDAHGATAAEARASAIAAVSTVSAKPAQPLEERLLSALEALPPDRVVSASELVAIIRDS